MLDHLDFEDIIGMILVNGECLFCVSHPSSNIINERLQFVDFLVHSSNFSACKVNLLSC